MRVPGYLGVPENGSLERTSCPACRGTGTVESFRVGELKRPWEFSARETREHGRGELGPWNESAGDRGTVGESVEVPWNRGRDAVGTGKWVELRKQSECCGNWGTARNSCRKNTRKIKTNSLELKFVF